VELLDVAAVVERAGAVSVLVDSTFATRVLLQPALHGVTLVPAAKAVAGAFRVATPAVSPGGRRRRDAVGERGGGR
jgi:cystathionine beta-lyase/cystathionine gamma-synthase